MKTSPAAVEFHPKVFLTKMGTTVSKAKLEFCHISLKFCNALSDPNPGINDMYLHNGSLDENAE